MASPTIPARREREALCDLFLEVGPDAPTLSGEWTARDLAAHLVMRESRPAGAAGIMVPFLSGWADRVQSSIAAREWTDLVAAVRTGPPIWWPTRISALDGLTNTVEFFVHHEDVRRAQQEWSVRDLDADLETALTGAMSRMAKLLTRRSKVGVVLEPTDRDVIGIPILANKAMPSVTVRGPIGEIVLFVYGRQAHSVVELLGNDEDVEVIRTASFGI